MVVAETDRPVIGEHINAPTEEERHTLRRVAGRIPTVAYCKSPQNASHISHETFCDSFPDRLRHVLTDTYN